MDERDRQATTALDAVVEAVRDALDERELVELLTGLIRVPSHREYPGEERQAAEYLADRLSEAGLGPRLEEVVGKRANMVCRIRGAGAAPTLLLDGHIDTIPPLDMPEPFSARIEVGWVHGRGAADMKAGVAAMAYALVLVKRAGLTPPGDVVFAGVVGEEYEGVGTRHVADTHRDIRFAVIGEPTNLRIANTHKGIEWMQVTFQGRSVHSSRPEEGVNSIVAAADFVRELRDQLEPALRARPHPTLGPSLVNVGVIHGGVQPNVIPANCRVEVERRWNPGESLEELYGQVSAIAEGVARRSGVRVTVSRMPYSRDCERPPLETSRDHRLVAALQECQKAWREPVGRPGGLPMCTDGPILARAGIPTVIFGPGDTRDAHSATERVEIAQVVRAARLYASLPFSMA